MVKRMYERVFRRKADIHLYEAFLDYYSSRNKFSPERWSYEELREVYKNAGKPVSLVNIWSGLLGHNTPNAGRSQIVYLAIHILSIVANSAGCERLFSEMGYIHSKRRNRLSYQKVFDTAVVQMELKRQHAALGLTHTRLQREFGIVDTRPNTPLPAEIAAEKDQRDETTEEIAEIDMLDDNQRAYNMTMLVANLCQETINDEDPLDNEATNSPGQQQVFFGMNDPILLKDMFDYNNTLAPGQGLDNFMQTGIANLQKELEVYDLATRKMLKSLLSDALDT
ncbi:hypothetical protein RhiJN_24875 [Ceratobasidium sp. AG-Ba]|nr:hypothetical protein RhiJN_24875 [Ceratobasidium sp. AG-Ba]